MTAATASIPSTTKTHRTKTCATLGLFFAAVVIVAGNYNVPKGDSGGTAPAIFTALLCAVLAAALFAIVVPRVRNHSRAGLVLGVLTVASLSVFWSGVTPILAAATFTVADRLTRPSRLISTMRWLAVAAAALSVIWTLVNSHF